MWLTVSFFLTFFKLFFLPFGISQIFSASKYLSVTILLLVILDILDGEVLKYSRIPIDLRDKTRRQVFDAIVDRLLMHTYLLLVLTIFNLSYWYYCLFLIRELILGYIVLRNYIKFNSCLKPNWFSKSANILLGIFVASISLKLNIHSFIFLIFSCIGVYSLIKYFYQSIPRRI